MRLRKTIVAVAACAAVMAGSLGLAGPASAGSNDGIADSGELIMHRDIGWNGPVYDEFFTLLDYRTKNFVGTSIRLNDEVSSAYNLDATFYAQMFKDINCTGAFLELTPYGGSFWFVDSLTPYGLNDQTSSHCWHT